MHRKTGSMPLIRFSIPIRQISIRFTAIPIKNLTFRIRRLNVLVIFNTSCDWSIANIASYEWMNNMLSITASGKMASSTIPKDAMSKLKLKVFRTFRVFVFFLLNCVHSVKKSTGCCLYTYIFVCCCFLLNACAFYVI